jgi:hypothetical protein
MCPDRHHLSIIKCKRKTLHLVVVYAVLDALHQRQDFLLTPRHRGVQH